MSTRLPSAGLPLLGLKAYEHAPERHHCRPASGDLRACQARPNPNIGRPVQAFARDGDRQVLVGGVLGAAEIGVRYPDRRHPEHLGEDVVRLGQEGRREAEIRDCSSPHDAVSSASRGSKGMPGAG